MSFSGVRRASEIRVPLSEDEPLDCLWWKNAGSEDVIPYLTLALVLLMRSTSEIIVFSLIMTSVLGLGHYYLWRRLVLGAELPKLAHRVLTSLVVFFLLSQPATFIMMRDTPQELLAPWAKLTFTWMGLLSSMFALLTLTDSYLVLKRQGSRLLRLFKPRSEETSVVDSGRRRLLGRALAGGVAFGGVTISGAAVAHARGLRLAKIEITLDKLPKQFDGFKIVQMSDIHVGPTIGRGFVEKIVRMANAESPDLIAITGDLVDGSVEHLGRHTAPFAELRAQHGAVFVTGNHEYYSGVDDWVEELNRLGIPTLRNEGLRVEREGASFLLAGVTDYRAGRYGDDPDLRRALASRRPGEEVILLAHQPRALSEAVEHDVGLQLSGHTHGGQFWPWSWIIHLIEPVVAGWAQQGRTQIYVSSGTGYWGPPMRLGTEAEITVVTLRSVET